MDGQGRRRGLAGFVGVVDVFLTDETFKKCWQVSELTESSITFSITDKSNSSLGMMGTVHASVTYSVTDSKWDIVMEATSPEAKTRGFSLFFSPSFSKRAAA